MEKNLFKEVIISFNEIQILELQEKYEVDGFGIR